MNDNFFKWRKKYLKYETKNFFYKSVRFNKKFSVIEQKEKG